MKKHPSHAKLLGIVEDGEYKEILDQPPYSVQVGYMGEETHKQAANRRGGIRSAGQMPVPHDEYSYYDVDTDTRSHRVLDSVNQPSYTKCNPGAAFGQPPPSGVRGSPTLEYSSMQNQAKYYTEHGPSGQPSRTTLPFEPPDIDQSSLHDYRYAESLRSRYTSVSTSLKFDKLQLNEREIHKVDSTHEVVVFGARGVGKTTIISCFLQDLKANITVLDQQFKMHGVSVALSHADSDKILRLNIQEAGNEITQEKINEYKRCEVAVVVYDVNNYDTLKKARCWINEIKQHIKEHSVEFILIGNKDDMVNNIDVMRKGMQLAIEMQMGHLVACAKNRLYMDKLLDDVATLACNQQSNSIESKLKDLEKNLERKFEDRQKTLEDNVKILKDSLEVSLRTIERLEQRRCVIL